MHINATQGGGGGGGGVWEPLPNSDDGHYNGRCLIKLGNQVPAASLPLFHLYIHNLASLPTGLWPLQKLPRHGSLADVKFLYRFVFFFVNFLQMLFSCLYRLADLLLLSWWVNGLFCDGTESRQVYVPPQNLSRYSPWIHTLTFTSRLGWTVLQPSTMICCFW